MKIIINYSKYIKCVFLGKGNTGLDRCNLHSKLFENATRNSLSLFSFPQPVCGQVPQSFASFQMNSITEFHHDVMSYLIFIFIKFKLIGVER